MRPKLLTWLPVIGVLTLAATPAMAQVNWYNGPYDGAAPSFYYQSPDGSYPSYSDFLRDLRGTPCGIQCTQRAEVRWGLVRPTPHLYHHHYYYRHY